MAGNRGISMDRKNGLARITGLYDHLEEYVLVGSLVLNVVLVFAQVIMRTVFRNSLTWSEELSRYIYIWEIWLGASIALREKQHIRVEMALGFLKTERAKAVLTALADIIWFLFNVYMIWNGYELLESMAGRKAVSSGMHIPMVLIYVAIPTASFLTALRLLGCLRDDFRTVISGKRDGGESA